MVEFALGAPFLLMAGLWGTEMANYALVNMKVGQLAVHIADNASRIGDASTLKDRKIYESDINDVIFGAQIQGGSPLDLYNHGRVIISSLEPDMTGVRPGEQYIHWQRCRGNKHVQSSYGLEGQWPTNGMGPPGSEVYVENETAVIFVELNYTYQPLISDRFIQNREISSISSFIVRDNRDLSQIYQRDPTRPDPVQRCSTFTGNVSIGANGSYN